MIMTIITWNHSCYLCHRPITGAMPVILFGIDKPLFVGLAHDTCYGDRPNFGRYRVKPPSDLFPEQIAFLVQFYPLLFGLPNGLTPNVALRKWLVDFIHHYPMTDPMMRLRNHIRMNFNKPIRYEGDLEADYIGFLAKVQQAAKENQIDVEFDFP